VPISFHLITAKLIAVQEVYSFPAKNVCLLSSSLAVLIQQYVKKFRNAEIFAKKVDYYFVHNRPLIPSDINHPIRANFRIDFYFDL
jgi:hypothetical protein